MDELAKRLFHDHKNPIVKLDLLGSKLFLRTASDELAEFNEQNQNILENVLRHTRVEKRCARAKAEWCPVISLSKVTKVVKGLLENFGFQDKRGIFMYPEEMLLLVESNRMEVSYKDVPLTLQECYQIISETVEMGLKKYLIYKKFVLHGYRLIRYKKVLERKLKDAGKESTGFSNTTKRCNSEDLENVTNKRKKEEQHNDLKETEKQLALHIENVFERMKKIAPKESIPFNSSNLCPDYCVFQPNNKSRTAWNFSLYICEELLDQPTQKEEPSPIYAVCSEDNISLCRLYNVSLPELPT
ncbi:uncharacterized protein [Leptinotarsa decemlineata]|uniref:uncharacterized protein n=1 Tax=Leptinotarsa decemlineata TaxID=7539 RepID=UPI003D3060B4